jgi:hypothetical protein
MKLNAVQLWPPEACVEHCSAHDPNVVIEDIVPICSAVGFELIELPQFEWKASPLEV